MGKYNTRGANKRIPRNVAVLKENLISTAGPDDEISTSKETNKKRKSSKTPVDFEKDPKRIRKTNSSSDSYCWKCHKIETEIEIFPEIECHTCPRSFHPSCIKATKIDKDRSCYVCQQQSNAKTTSNIDDEIHLSKLLLHIIDTACPMDKEEYKAIVDWPNSAENEKLICKKDFRLIHDRCIQKGIQYESHVELVDDIEWILHNCIIIYGDKSPIATSAKKILLLVQRMLKDALDCPECYYKKIGNEPLTFLNICKTPHPLVWAKVKGFSYWPAKCLKVSNQKANVRFFHTHQLASVPLSNVLAMSEDYPSNSSKKLDKKSKNNVDFVMAKAELEAYVDIFKDHYGTFPYEPINVPFDFEKEENILKNLIENHSRKTIVSEDTFPSSPNNESESRPTVVDLTDDVSENGEDQIQDNVALPIHENPVAATLFEQEVPMASAMASDDDFLENANRSVTETNSSDNAKSVIAAIESDTMLKTGLRNSVEFIQGKEFQSIAQAISGSLLPSQTSDEISTWFQPTNRIPSPAGISISNVISGTDVPSGTDLLGEVAHCDAEPVMQNTNFAMNIPSTEPDPFQSTSVFSSSSNSMQLCLRNYDRASETGDFCDDDNPDIEIIDEVSSMNAKKNNTRSDTDCILQTILRHDPKSLTMLKQANLLVQQLFIQFWGSAAKVPKAEKIIQSQEYEIRNLKTQLEERRREITLLKNATYEEKMRNADNIVQCLKANINSQEERFRKEQDKFKEEIEKLQEENDKLKQENENLKEEKEKHERALKKELDKVEKRFNERLKEAKTLKYCSLIDCFQPAKILCCYSGIRSFAYCNEKCKAKDDIHKRFECKAGKKTSPLKQPEEKEESTPGQVVARGVVQQSTTSTIYIHSEITSSSASSPQTSSANIHKINKVVAAKKTYEMSRNINRNHNASDIY